MDLNVNKAECLIRKTELGYDRVVNICTNTEMYISWGVGDWAKALLILLIVLGLSGFITILVKYG